MIKIRAVLPMLVLLAIAGVSEAVDLSAQSRTYLQSRETVKSTKLMPLYEYLDFRAENLGSKSLSFHFGGWYRYDLEDESFGKKQTGELQYAYLGYRAAKGNAFINMGRVMVNQGVASELVDGAAAGTDLAGGFQVSAFGGSPVETSLDTRSGDSVYGGRLSQGSDGVYRIGVSYLLEKNDSRDFREEEGVDLWFRPIDKVELLGSALYNALNSACAQRDLYLTLGPFKNLTLRTRYTLISYKDYFTSTLMSAFQLAPGGPVDPDEKLTTIGEEAALSLGAAKISADYKRYDYRLVGAADYYGGKATFNFARNNGAGISLHRMDGQVDNLKYNEYRLYGYGKIQKIDITADVLMVKYDAPINGVENAYTAALAGGYSLTPKAALGADVEYSKNPYYSKDVRALVKFVYNFDLAPAATGRK